MEYLKLKLPTVRIYVHTLPPCWSTNWSVYPSSLDLPIKVSGASLIVQLVKNLPAMQETRVRVLSPEDPLEKEMATHSRILTWRIPWTEEPGRLQSMGSQESDTTWWLNHHYHHTSQQDVPSFLWSFVFYFLPHLGYNLSSIFMCL